MWSMHSKALKIILFIIITIVFISLVGNAADDEEKIGVQEIVTVPAGKIIDGDYFAVGKTVEISGVINGDAYIAAGQVLIDGTVNGDLLVSCGTLSILGTVSQDARIAAGRVTVSGEIGKNMTIGGGDIELTNSSSLHGGLVAAGGNILLGGPIGSNTKIAAGNATVSNRIDGNLDAVAGSLRLTSKAAVAGDLSYWSRQPASIDDKAQIAGNVIRKSIPEEYRLASQKIRDLLIGLSFLQIVINFISTLILGLLLIRYFPKYAVTSATVLKERPLASIGLGFLVLIVAPFVLALLMATVVGVPLALILTAWFLITLYLSRVFVIFWAGMFIVEKLKKEFCVQWSYIVGLLVYYLCAAIPIIGGLIVFLVILWGLGASLLTKKRFYLDLRSQDLV